MSEWIEWKGGECPVDPDAEVYWSVRCDEGTRDYRVTARAGDLFWGRKAAPHPMDLVEYRVVPK